MYVELADGLKVSRVITGLWQVRDDSLTNTWPYCTRRAV